MIGRTNFCFPVFVLIACFASVSAQNTPAPKTTKSPTKDTSTTDKNKAASDEAKKIEEQRRASAIAVLISLSDEARNYRDQALRARIQSRAADLLWEIDVEKARQLFRRAWDAADVADAESQRRLDEERRAQIEAGRPGSVVSLDSLRTEVLRAVARRDRKLGEELLAKLDDARKQEATNASNGKNNSTTESDPFELPPALKLRIRLAQQLLETDVTRAIEFAGPALTRISIEGVVFLSYLRQKNALSADERYSAMLAAASVDPSSDANTISVLSSYLFTPFQFVRFTPDGSMNSNRYNQPAPPPEVTAELRLNFLRIAEQVFLRPLSPPEQDRTTSGLAGKYLVMTRMLPYFQQFAPEQSTTLVKAQLTAISREVPEGYRQQAAEGTDSRDTDSDDEGGSTIDSLLKRIERAENQSDRDQLYVELAVLASEKGDPRAQDFADKIEDSDVRKSVRAYVDFNAARHAIEKKRVDDALKIIKSGTLTSMQRVWALTLAAQTLVKSDRDKAIEILDEAALEARRIGGSSADRPRALVGVATVLYEASHGAGWELMSEVVRAANNSSEDFSGEDARIVSRLETKNQTSMLAFSVNEFDLPGVFRSMAKEDLQRAILLAKDFNGESPRATALMAIARSVLETKPAEKQKRTAKIRNE